MTKEEFVKILKEYKFKDVSIEKLWRSRPSDNIDEERLRLTAIKIKLSQK